MKRPLAVPSDLAEELDRLRQRVAELERDQAARPEPRETAGPVPSSHYRLLYEDTPSMSFGLTPDGTVLSVNRFGAEQLGYVPDELIGRSVLTVFDPADHRTVQDQLTVCAQHPYKIFQWDLQKLHRSGRRLWVRETARAVRDESGALLVLVMCEDITKRKAAEEETRTLTDTLEALIRTSPLAIMALDNLGENVTLWNHAAESMFGWSEEEVLGRPAPFLTEDRREHSDRLWAELLERGKLQGAELRRIRRDGTPIDLSLWAMVLRDERGDIVGTFGLLADITERKQMEASLRLSEQAIRELYEITSGTTSTFDEQVRAVLDLGRRRFQLPVAIFSTARGADLELTAIRSDYPMAAEGTLLPLRDTYCSETLRVDEPIALEHIGASDWKGLPAYSLLRFESYLGTKLSVHGTAVGSISFLSPLPYPATFTESDKHFLQLMARWLSSELERRQAETALRESEERFRLMFEKAPVGMCIVKQDRTLRDVNSAFQKMLGYSKDELVGTTYARYSHPDDVPDNLALTDRFLRRDIPGYSVETRYLRHDGQYIWVNVTASSLQLPGEPDRLLLAIVEDITDRKQAERELSIVRERLQYLMAFSPTVIYSCRISDDYRATYVSDNVVDHLGYEPREFVDVPGCWDAHIHPDDRPRVIGELPRLFQRGSHVTEYRFLHKDGTYRWMHDRMKLVHDPAGNPMEIIGSWIDITDRKRAESALRFTQFAVDHAGDLIFWISQDARILYANEAAAQRLGYSREELYRMTVADIDPNYQREVWPRHWEDLRRNKKLRFESCHRTRTGELYPAEIVANYVTFEGQEYNFAFTRDISERKRAEEALRNSEERFGKAFRSSPHPIIVTDLETGRCLEVNEASLQLFGFQREEVIGQSTITLGLWPTPADRKRLMDQLRDAGSLRNLDLTFYAKDRTARRFLISCELIELNGTKCVVTVGTDITEQKRAEEALRRSELDVRQAFEERERLSQDLHDNLLQSLYAIGMGLEITKQRIKRISQTNAKRLEESVGQLNAVIREVREFIPRMHASTSRPGSTADALQSLAGSFVSTGAGHIALTIDPDAASQLTPEESAHVIAIAKEALSNSIRHTRAANRSLTLKLHRGSVRLEVTDDGEGFQLHRKDRLGMGIQNMRARAAKLDARLAIRTSPGKGTRLTLDLRQPS